METLKSLRIENKKTVAEIATALGVQSRTLLRYEQGIRRISYEQVILLTQLYGCSAEEIIKAQLNSCQLSRLDNQH